LIEDVILHNVPKDVDEPYEYYYDKYQMKNFDDIDGFYIGGELYNFTYSPNPSKDYDRLTKDLGDMEFRRSICQGEKCVLKREVVDKKKYTSVMKKLGKDMGFSPLKGVRQIRKRI